MHRPLILPTAVLALLLVVIPVSALPVSLVVEDSPLLGPSFPVSTAPHDPERPVATVAPDEQRSVPLARPVAMPGTAGPALRLADLLNADGTLSLPRGVYGSIDPTGYQMAGNPDGTTALCANG